MHTNFDAEPQMNSDELLADYNFSNVPNVENESCFHTVSWKL